MAGVTIYIGLTDRDWHEFLCQGPRRDEVNFWQPSGRTQFRALRPGELFLFKLHHPHNYIVGGGIFGHASILPVSLAWEVFEQGNGAPNLAAMRKRIAKYRRETEDRLHDYPIGCRLLEEPFFWPEEDWIPTPASWAPSIQVGKSFDATQGDGLALWDAVQSRFAARSGQTTETQRFGPPRLIEPRLGQGTFRVAVTDAYERRCALTGERTLPILDAAHIRGYSDGGAHRLENGLLLRTDVHRLFDRGYVTIGEDRRFVVGRRLKDDFDNGRHYYDMHGQSLRPPRTGMALPSSRDLEWHRENRFLG